MTVRHRGEFGLDNQLGSKTEIRRLYNVDASKRASISLFFAFPATILLYIFFIYHDVILHKLPFTNSLIVRGPALLPLIVFLLLYFFRRSFAKKAASFLISLYCFLLNFAILSLTILTHFHVSYVMGILMPIFISCLLIPSGTAFTISTFIPVCLFYLITHLFFEPEMLSIQMLNNVLGLLVAGLIITLVFSKLRFERFLSGYQLKMEQQRSEDLLLNILPDPIAQRLKNGEQIIADHCDQVTVLFSDIVGFTKLSAQLTPEQLVHLLNGLFTKFDHLTTKYGVEKIKTIGDAYMVVSGIPEYRTDHGNAIADLALDMRKTTEDFQNNLEKPLNIRIGIHSGPVVAGVIGKKKFAYDLWGDTVNVASRMESHGIAGEIQVSESTYHLLKDQYYFEKRGEMEVKGKGKLNTWILKHKLYTGR